MAASLFVRGVSRNCLRAGSNGLCRSAVVISPQVCRAFAVAPFKAAFDTRQLMPQLSNTSGIALLSRVSKVQHSISRCSSSGDHVRLWTAERVLSVTLLAAIPAAFFMPTIPVETFLALTLTVHGHWGIEALVHDYVRPSVFGDIIPKLSVAIVYGISVVTFGSLCYFIFTDVGIVNAVSMLWKL